MTNEDSHESAGVDDLRDELKSELLRAARAREERRRTRLRKWGLPVAAVVAVAIPGTLAVAGLAPEEEEPVFQPAPPPLFAGGGAYADCPQEIQELVIELDPDEYARSPGYPVAGCPTVEALEELRPSFDESLDTQAAPGGPLEDCPPEVLDALREDEHRSEYTENPVAGCPTDLLPTDDLTGGGESLRELEQKTRSRSPER